MGKKIDLTGQRFGRLTVLREAGKNSCRNHKEFYNGEYLSIAEISRRCGINQSTIDRRLKSGLTIQEAITLPLHYNRKLLLKSNN